MSCFNYTVISWFKFVVNRLGIAVKDKCSFTLSEMDSGADFDSDSTPDGYIVADVHVRVHIAQPGTWIPTPRFCTGQKSEPVSGNVNES